MKCEKQVYKNEIKRKEKTFALLRVTADNVILNKVKDLLV